WDSSEPISCGQKKVSQAKWAWGRWVARRPLRARSVAFMVGPLRSGRAVGRPVHIVRDPQTPPDLAPLPDRDGCRGFTGPVPPPLWMRRRGSPRRIRKLLSPIVVETVEDPAPLPRPG